MESPSAPAPRGWVPWQGLLLAVSLLTFRSLPATAQLTVASISATEGTDVLLLVHSLPENLLGYAWYKGETTDTNRLIATYAIATQKSTPGPAYNGRETIYPNGSLLLQNVTLQDTGYYTMQALEGSLQGATATGELRVYLLLAYQWETPATHTGTLFIPSITANDSGAYTCLTHNSVTGFNRTTVRTITVSEPVGKPSIRARNTTVTEHKDTVVLTCLTNDTGISTWWFFRDQSLGLTERTKLSQDNSTLIIEPVRREDAGGYQCEVSNPVSTSRSDPLRLEVQTENDYTGYPAGTIAGIVIGVLVLVALGTTLGYFIYHRRTRRASDKRGLTEHRPPASTPGQGPSGASTSLGPLPGTRTAGPIYEDLLHPSTDVYCRVNPRADGAA